MCLRHCLELLLFLKLLGMEELRKTLKSHKIKGKTLSECIGRIQQHQDLENDWPTLLSQFSNVAETIHTLPKFLGI